MKTRSQTGEFEVNIDFDEASLAWMENKKKIKNGCYIYKCEHMCKNGKRCNYERVNNSVLCKRHLKYNTANMW